jgi:hypothetical protein
MPPRIAIDVPDGTDLAPQWLMKTSCIVMMLALAGCAHERVKPDDMSASAHREQALHEQAKADGEYAKYDPAARQRILITGRGPQGTWASSFNPTDEHRDNAARIEQHAQEHLAAAAELESFADQACRPFAPRVRAACPALGPIAFVENIRGGVRMHLQRDMPLDAVIAHMRCHLAYAREHGYLQVPDCPLYLRGVEIRPAADGSGVELIARDRDTIDELRRRARVEIASVPAI